MNVISLSDLSTFLDHDAKKERSDKEYDDKKFMGHNTREYIFKVIN